MLHLVNKSPFYTDSLNSCLKFAAKGTPVLLIEDGVYGAMSGTSLEPKMTEVMKDHPIYVLKEDVMARGIANLIQGVKEIDYTGFVELAEQHRTCTWS